MKAAKLIVFALGIMFVACSDSHDEVDGPEVSKIEKDDNEEVGNEDNLITGVVRIVPIEVKDEEKCVVSAYNRFAWNLLHEIVASDAGHNHVISPISASWALDMLANGAEGDTQSEILSAMNTKDIGLDRLNDLNAKVTENLGKVDPSMVVEAANSLWHSQSLSMDDRYVKTLKTDYAAEANTLDDESPEAKVNQWIEAKTHGLVKDLITPGIIKDFALVNTLYLKGSWAAGYKFNVNKTAEGPFRNINGDVCNVYFMQNKAGYATYSTNHYQCFSIPLGAQSYSLNIILPNASSGVSECIRTLADNDNMQSVVKTVTLKLPKFTIDTKLDFVNVLSTLGIKKAFNADADFSAISAEPLSVSTMLQGTNISVDEAGIEGGTATAIMDVAGSLGSDGEEEEITVDRPFMFYISEISTGLVLMAGQIVTL